VTSTAPPDAPDPTAVVGRRIGAAAIDLGIIWVFGATFWLLASEEVPREVTRLVDPCTGRSLCTNVNDRVVDGWPMVLLVVAWITYLVGVFVLQRGLTGRTVGTMLTGVVVVDTDGRPLGPGKALVRSLAGVVDYLPCCLPIVGFVTILAAPAHRRVGDMAVESVVVGNEWFGRPIVLPGPAAVVAPAPAPPDGYPAQPPIPPAAQPPTSPAPAMAPVAPTAASSPPLAGSGPVWDPERRAYLQWDAGRAEWLQFDQATQEWHHFDVASGRWRPVER
jgi:uncharacterized RDD family membrane protein YckC